MQQTENQQEMEAFLKGKPVSPEFLAELESRTGKLINGLEVHGWNLDRVGAEMTELFRQADAMFQQPHYQKQASADELDTPSADLLPIQQTNQEI